ncbi:MAG: hypothetical protein OEY85_13455 [Rhodospirillales bacterium]|nr:hypothetical protein [Rhodospirillales bacterium]
MRWFGPKLEPGERMLARDPEAFVMWFMRICAVGMVAGLVGFALDGDVILAILMAGGIAALVLPDLRKQSRGLYQWHAALTDRRLIYRSDNDKGYVAVPLAELDLLQERDPEEILADQSEENQKMVKLLGKSRIRDDAGTSIGVQHDEQSFYFQTGKKKTGQIREIIETAKGEA